MVLSVQRMSCRVCATSLPLLLLKSATHLSPSCLATAPPIEYIQVVKCQPPWLFLLYSAKPTVLFPSAVIFLAASRTSAQVLGGLFGSRPASVKSLRLYSRPME